MRLRDTASADPDRAPQAVVDAALDAGARMVDTADAYRNEELVGRLVAARRDEVFLATKFGLVWRTDVAGEFEVRADPAYVRQACAGSASTSSTCTTSTTAAPTCPSRRPSAPWPSWWHAGTFGHSACPT